MTAGSGPRVSVIIPAFNAGPFMTETLDSVFSQTLAPAEVIVVDDGSSDDTRETVRAYHRPVQLLDSPNLGAAAARNLGASHATGDWLAFLDADDVWLADKLERQLAAADGGTALVYCDRLNTGIRAGLPEKQSEIQPLVEGDAFVDLLVKGNVITTSGVLLRAAVFRDLGGFDSDERLLPAEDWDLWLRVAAVHPIRACPEALIAYRLHAQGMSRRLDQMMRARTLVVARALASPRGRALGALLKRRIWSETWRANGWDAARHGAVAKSLRAYGYSLWYWPFVPITYTGIARVLLGRG
jgi:glycosyltransferase involved in cell wall biosynthesis